MGDNTYFRLRVVTFDNVPWVCTMKKCEHYFPTVEFWKETGGGEGDGEGTREGKGKGKGVWSKRVWGKEGDGVGGMGGVVVSEEGEAGVEDGGDG